MSRNNGFPPLPIPPAGNFDGGNYEVVEFIENGEKLYYICIKGTKTKVEPKIGYRTPQEATRACLRMNI
ncbi:MULTISPECIES: hypothetical protein [Pectobacterium]|uniref:hypothetical protein n=1 Tax=Pectobacterium TaxID=122277 RepID=UPI0011AEF8DA|nr:MULTISPECIES: hypothetical protein [Pectobacterium]MBQ4778590.1 hypothetical protein [Pectobacterium versatile]